MGGIAPSGVEQKCLYSRRHLAGGGADSRSHGLTDFVSLRDTDEKYGRRSGHVGRFMTLDLWWFFLCVCDDSNDDETNFLFTQLNQKSGRDSCRRRGETVAVIGVMRS